MKSEKNIYYFIVFLFIAYIFTVAILFLLFKALNV